MFKKTILFSMITLLLGTTVVFAAEIDDAAIFVEAFNAFQKNDYLLAIEKGNQLNQIFPDSPLRDVNLLLIARSSVKSGDNELAAKTINKFTGEFSDSALTGTIEEDLLALGARHLKGEQLQPDTQLQVAAQKIRDDRLALERVAALKLEQERLAREKVESERREHERIARERAERDDIKSVISVPEGGLTFAAGQNGTVPIEISNRGKNVQEFLLEVSAAREYGAFIASAGKSDESVTRVKLAAGETFRGRVLFRMPSHKVDGDRSTLSIRTISSKYRDVVQTKNSLVIASAPLVRVVAKLAKPKVTPGEQLRYRVTLLNIGSLSAQDLTARVQLPPELEFVAAPDHKFRQEQNGTLLFRVERLETGKLTEIGLEVKVKENCRVGQELRGQVEVVNGQLQRKELFTASASVVQAKP